MGNGRVFLVSHALSCTDWGDHGTVWAHSRAPRRPRLRAALARAWRALGDRLMAGGPALALVPAAISSGAGASSAEPLERTR